MNIGIIFGGKSFEHEISIITAYQLKNKLKDYYDIYMIYIDIKGNIFDCSKMSFNEFKLKRKTKIHILMTQHDSETTRIILYNRA